MDSSFWFDTIKGLKLPNDMCILSILKISFVFANSVEPDEMSYNAAFDQVFNCLPTYTLRVTSIQRVLHLIITSLNTRAINDNPADCMNNI